MDFNIVDFGARASDVILDASVADDNRMAIQTAIDAAHSKGGGRVVVPAGDYVSGSLVLKSSVTLYLEEGSRLIASLDQTDIRDVATDFEDATENTGWSGGCFLYARDGHDISLDGTGVIYCQGDEVFYDDGADGLHHECPKNVRLQPWVRPRTTYFENIQRLTVRGVTFRDAAFWTLHMAGCRSVLVDGVRIENDVRGANNDGIDPDCCKDVVITNCIVSSGDDAIVIKSTAPMAERYGSCENIIISNCILSSHDSALKIGTETYGAIRGVLLSDCIFRDCSRGVGIWVRDGGVVEDVHVHHVTGNTLRYADCPDRDFAPRWWGKGEPVFLSATPRATTGSWPGVIRNITFDHMYMTCESCIFIAGEKDSLIEGIEISDVRLIQRRQGTQPPCVFDEQPSARDVYEHDIPLVYIRSAASVTIRGAARRDLSYRGYPSVMLEEGTTAAIDVQLKEIN